MPLATARPRTRTAADAAEIGERCGDADLIACARHHAGPDPHPTGAGRGGAGAARRGHGRSHRGGAVAPHDGLDLLQRDRGLSAGVCAGPRPRVDLRPGAVVRGATGDGRLHRRLPGASRRDHAVAGRLAGGDRGGASAPASGPRGSTSRPPPRRSTSRRRCTASAASSRRPRRRTEAPASGAWSRSPAWPCCGWRKAAPRRRPLRFAALWARRRIGCSARATARLHRDHAGRRRRRRKRVAPATSWRRSPELRYRRAGRDGRACPRRGRTGRRRRPGRARLAAPCLRGVAAGRGAVRRRARARADRAGLPRAWRRRRRQAGAGCGQSGVRAAGSRARPCPHRLADPGRIVELIAMD